MSNDQAEAEALIASAMAANASVAKPDAAGGDALKPAPTAKSTNEIENLLDDTEAAVSQAQIDSLLGSGAKPPAAVGSAPKPYELDDLQGQANDEPPHSMELLGDVELDLRIELGRTVMRLDEVLRLRGGSVVALDKLAGDPVDIYINGRLIAHGEVLVMNDNFCIRVTELAGSSAQPIS